jgi:hypothetical protein
MTYVACTIQRNSTIQKSMTRSVERYQKYAAVTAKLISDTKRIQETCSTSALATLRKKSNRKNKTLKSWGTKPCLIKTS